MRRLLSTMDPHLRRTLWGFLAVVGCILVFAWLAFGQPLDANHPELAWMTFETEHFVVHYHEGAERTAMTIARIAEEIHPKITSLYRYEPDTKFHFIVKDTDDYANGAAYYYNNKMLIWSTALDYELRGTKNWLRMVITHEYTHIIQLGAARKLPRNLPAVYLQVLGYEEEKRPDVLYGYPNVLVSYPFPMTIIPMWFAEGSAQVDVGDALPYDFWDSHRDMQLRMRALNDAILPLNEMEVFGKESLGNEGVYNHGYSLVRYIVDQWGIESLREITEEASHPGQYDFNAALERALGVGGEELHDRWSEKLKQRYDRQTAVVREHLVRGDSLQSLGTANLYPLWTPDGSALYFISNRHFDYFGDRSLWKMDAETGEVEMVEAQVDGPFDISADGRWLVFSRIERQRTESYYADLFVRDLNTGDTHRLTRSARALEPAISPDGRTIVCVVNRDGTKHLARLTRPEGTEWDEMELVGAEALERLTDYHDGSRAYRPRISPDGSTVLYARSRKVGRDVVTIPIGGGPETVLAGGPGDQRDPVWAENGTSVLFSDDITGIFNIYRLDPATGERAPLTNVLGGAFMPVEHPDGEAITFARWGLDGYTVAQLHNPAPLPERWVDYTRDYRAVLPEPTYDDSEVDTLDARPYRPTFEKLFFVPRIAFDYGTFKPGLYAYSSDVLEKLNLFAGGAINARGEFDLMASLDFKALRPTLFAEMYYIKRNHSERFEDPYVIVDEVTGPDGPVPVFDTYGVDYSFHLMEFDAGARMRLATPLMLELRAWGSRYDSFLDYDDGTTFQYTYFQGLTYQARLDFNAMPPMVKGNVHPRTGWRGQLTAAWENNEFIDGFEINATSATLEEVYTPYRYWRFEGDVTGWHSLYRNLVVQPRMRFGYLDKQVDPFMHLYGGGMHGMRGYSYYALGGTRKVIASLALRHPIWEPGRPRFGWIHMDGLYLGLFGDVGDVWRERGFEAGELKTDAGLELRAKLYSWYGFPTAVTLAAARGFDTFSVTENNTTTVYEPTWRFYLSVLFEFETIFPSRGALRR